MDRRGKCGQHHRRHNTPDLAQLDAQPLREMVLSAVAGTFNSLETSCTTLPIKRWRSSWLGRRDAAVLVDVQPRMSFDTLIHGRSPCC